MPGFLGAQSQPLTPEVLVAQITSPNQSDKEKVQAIFNWITANIDYNITPWRNLSRHNQPQSDEVDTGALKPLDERVAIDVLAKRKAFCDGYSRLFKTLCDYARVPCEVVTGYADVGRGKRNFKTNHRWNAVFFDGAWHLVDATWASGYIAFGDEFVRRYNDNYFLTPAQSFARDHYPEELRWTLLPEPPMLSEFRFSPFKTNAFTRNRIFAFKPTSGVIEAAAGDTLQFEIEANNDSKKVVVASSAVNDSVVNELLPNAGEHYSVSGNKIIYRYVVTDANVRWLHVYMNNEVVLRYAVTPRKLFAKSN